MCKKNTGLNSSDFNKKLKSDKNIRLELFNNEYNPIDKKYLLKMQSLNWESKEWDLLNNELNNIKKELKTKYKL